MTKAKESKKAVLVSYGNASVLQKKARTPQNFSNSQAFLEKVYKQPKGLVLTPVRPYKAENEKGVLVLDGFVFEMADQTRVTLTLDDLGQMINVNGGASILEPMPDATGKKDLGFYATKSVPVITIEEAPIQLRNKEPKYALKNFTKYQSWDILKKAIIDEHIELFPEYDAAKIETATSFFEIMRKHIGVIIEGGMSEDVLPATDEQFMEGKTRLVDAIDAYDGEKEIIYPAVNYKVSLKHV